MAAFEKECKGHSIHDVLSLMLGWSLYFLLEAPGRGEELGVQSWSSAGSLPHRVPTCVTIPGMPFFSWLAVHHHVALGLQLSFLG